MYAKKKKIGQNIRLARKQKGYNLVQFADKIGVSKSTLSDWENGVSDMTLSRFVKVVTELGVSADDLLKY